MAIEGANAEAAGAGNAGTGGSADGNTQQGVVIDNGSGSTGSAGKEVGGEWYASIEDAGLRDLAKSKGWNEPVPLNVMKSYKELETAYSAKQAGNATPDVSAASDYKFNVPTDLPEGVTYDVNFADWFKEQAFSAKMTTAQASTLHDAWVEMAKSTGVASANAAAEAQAARVSEALGGLTKEWGQQGTPTFSRNLEMARRAIEHGDKELGEALKATGLLVESNGQTMVANAPIMRALAKMGAAMYTEDSVFGRVSDGENPFDANSKLSPDERMELQGQLIAKDPAKAALLINAAGPDARRMYASFLERHRSGR